MAKKKKVIRKNKDGGLLSRLRAPSDESSQLSLSEFVPNIERDSALKIFAVTVFLVAILFVFAMFGAGGYVGSLLLASSITVFGLFGYLVPMVLAFLAYYIYVRRMPDVTLMRTAATVAFILSFSGFMNLASGIGNTELGGLIGNILAVSFNSLFSYYPAILFTTILSGYSLYLVSGLQLSSEYLSNLTGKMSSVRSISMPIFSMPNWLKRTATDEYEDSEEYDAERNTKGTDGIRSHILENTPGPVKRTRIRKERIEEIETENQDVSEESGQENTDKNTTAIRSKRQYASNASETVFTAPPLSLLQRDSGKASVGDTKTNMSVIKRTLSEFGIQVEMDEVSIGPSVTRYALKPAQGVKLSRIANHRQELAYALRAESIRIEAPIPGKALVGIEIPNEVKSMVGLASLFSAPGWDAPDKPLLVALGKGISGTPLFSNLAKMPHLLIAGTTGSGKSVMVHTIINSLIFRNSPLDLKFIMVDPKKVELTLYNNIPHLYTPVITNPKLTIRTLNWAVNEMERRYDRLEEEGVRDIGTYHTQVYKAVLKKNKNDDSDLPERMPYIVIIIDELADIMMSYPKELEAAIVRLAQKSRAVGIHLILSTQRPSVNVITGLIKANIPSRIALKVASQIDSRTIIDTAGAEQLLGQGDLLFTSSESPKQERVQSAFVSDGEVKRVVDYLKQTYRDSVPDEINIETAGNDRGMQTLFGADLGSIGGGDTDDDLFEQAREIVISSRKASTSYLQRRLKIGYSRAARLMDMLEERGVIGAGDGAKAREVLIGSQGADGDYSSDEE